MAISPIRRVVTGTSPEGKSMIVSDTAVVPTTISLAPGGGFYSLWGADTPLALPESGDMPAMSGWFPPAAGVRFEAIVIPAGWPETPPPADPAGAVAEADAKLPGLLAAMEPDHPGMHRTDSVDFVYVMSGRCLMVVDDGVTTELGPGDVVVQNGTRHGWHVPFGEPCRLLCISIGATRKP